MNISAKLVMELRAKTNAGMMDCKKALIECDGNLEDSIRYLREKGIMKAARKADRITAEGLVFEAISQDEKKGVILELNSETDFVAKNEAFQAMGTKLANHILNNDIANVDALNESILDGISVQELIADSIAKIGENIHLRRFAKEESEDFITTYIHMGGKIGVILNLEGDKNEDNMTKAKDVAMHVAAMAPEYLTQEDVPQDVLDNEKSIMKAQLLEEGKPEHIIDKILIGKVQKFNEENCLLQQKFVKDDKITVQEYLGTLTLKSYSRYKLGEGIEKGETDFAAEVAAQIKG